MVVAVQGQPAARRNGKTIHQTPAHFGHYEYFKKPSFVRERVLSGDHISYSRSIWNIFLAIRKTTNIPTAEIKKDMPIGCESAR